MTEEEKITDQTDPKKDEELNEDPPKAAHPDLEEFIDEFGEEDGVQFYREGLDIEEARKEEYAQLKAEKAALKQKEATPEKPGTETPASKSDTVAATLKDEVKGLKQEIARLKQAMPRGERDPVSHGEPEKKPKPDTRSSVVKLAEKYAKLGYKVV